MFVKTKSSDTAMALMNKGFMCVVEFVNDDLYYAFPYDKDIAKELSQFEGEEFIYDSSLSF